MITSSKLRDTASSINLHTASYKDLTNAIGEVRLLLARMVIEKDARLNAQAREAAQVIHDEEQKERDDFEQHVREVVENKE